MRRFAMHGCNPRFLGRDCLGICLSFDLFGLAETRQCLVAASDPETTVGSAAEMGFLLGSGVDRWY